MRSCWLALLYSFAIGASSAELSIGSMSFALGAPQGKVLADVNANFRVSSVTGQPTTFFLSSVDRANSPSIGSIAFTNGRLTWAQRTWGSYVASDSAADVSKALYSAIESASAASGSAAAVAVTTRRVPGITFVTTYFRFKDRTVTMLVSDGDAANGGRQVSVTESIGE
jgi:hypothetical protein